jgi:hypothetical protein
MKALNLGHMAMAQSKNSVLALVDTQQFSGY